jgi:hypothetical protein
VLVLLAIASAVALHAWNARPHHWEDPDSLFYRAAVLRIQGTDKREALTRVVNSDIARLQRHYEQSEPAASRRVTSPAWMTYTSRFYERRWVVPLVGAALDPIFGADGLVAAALIGYVLFGPLLYLLLRQRFTWKPSALVTAAMVLLHTTREWSSWPMTDTWGLALECLALAAGLIALERAGRWIVVWALAVLALSFTRDTAFVLLAGALASSLALRDRRSVAVLVAGVAAALPAPLIFGGSYRETLAYTVNDFYPPANPSWGFALDHFLPSLRHLVREDLSYLQAHLVDSVALVGGFVALLTLNRLLRSGRWFVIGAAAGSLATLLLLPNYSAMRLELVVLPFSALGLAGALTVVMRFAEQRLLPSNHRYSS